MSAADGTTADGTTAQDAGGVAAGARDLDRRDVRALTEQMVVLAPDADAAGDDQSDADTVADDGASGGHEVVTAAGEEYTVDVCERRCTCADATYNLGPEGACKHVRRVEYRAGDREVPEWASADALSPGLRAVLRSQNRL